MLVVTQDLESVAMVGNIEQLYDELSDHIRLKDDEGVRRVYRDLLHAGRSRSEVVGEVIRLGLVKHGTGEKIPGGGDLNGSETTNYKFEPNAAGRSYDLVFGHENIAIQQVRDFDLPALGVTAEQVPDQPELERINYQPTDRVSRFTISLWSTIARWRVVAILVTAIASATGALLLRPTGDLLSAHLANVAQSQHTPEAAASNATPAQALPPLAIAVDGPPTPRSGATLVDATFNPTTLSDTAGSAEKPSDNSAVGAASIVAPVAGIQAIELQGSAGSSPTLLARGDALFRIGDLASARLFYERAADAGDPTAAVQLGETYDPAFLVRARLGGGLGDASLAAYWYERARELGAPEAEMLLRTIVLKEH